MTLGGNLLRKLAGKRSDSETERRGSAETRLGRGRKIWESRELEDFPYQVGDLVGKGSYGEVLTGTCLRTGTMVAIKRRATEERTRRRYEEEACHLSVLQGVAAVPTLLAHGTVDGFSVIVMEMLGQSVWDLFAAAKGRFSPLTVLLFADQMISRIEEVHSVGLVHRDIKPDNFLMGLNDKAGVVHIADFGLATYFRDPITHGHVQFRHGKTLTGSARFASIKAHDSTQSRRDDMESLGYNLAYLVRGTLPWQSMENGSQDRFEEIRRLKKHTSARSLCQDCPEELTDFIRYCRKLEFEQTPNYSYLRSLIRNAIGCGGVDVSDECEGSTATRAPRPGSAGWRL